MMEMLYAGWFENVEDADNVLVVEMPEELDFAQSAETEHGMVKGGDFLDRDSTL